MYNKKYTESVCSHDFQIVNVTYYPNQTEVYCVCNICNQEEKWIITKKFKDDSELSNYMNGKIACNTDAYKLMPSFTLERSKTKVLK